LAESSKIAGENGIQMTICSQPEVLTAGPAAGLAAASCIDAARLSDVAGYDTSARRKGNRVGCLCVESRDIGTYDTCAHGCVYCYAVSDHDRAVTKLRRVVP